MPELFNIFQTIERSHLCSLYLRILESGLWLKAVLLVFFLCSLLSDFLYGFRSSWSNKDPLTVAFDQIPRVFNKAGATQVVALDISNTFNRVWNAIFFHKQSYRTSVKDRLILSFLTN